MAKSMRGDPRFPNPKLLTVPLKELYQRSVAQRLSASFAPASNEKDMRTLHIRWAFMHHVVTHGLQGLRLEQINHPLCPRFRSCSLGMVVTIPHYDALARVGDIVEVKIEHFACPPCNMSKIMALSRLSRREASSLLTWSSSMGRGIRCTVFTRTVRRMGRCLLARPMKGR